MKKLIAVLALCLLASLSSAQATVSIGARSKVADAAQVAKNNKGKLLANRALCYAKSVPQGLDCTQAQLNAMPGCAAGACGTIYTLDGAGDADFALDKMFACHFSLLDSQLQEINIRDAAAAVVSNGSDLATNTVCANAGLSNGCTKFAVSCMVLKGTPDCK